MWHLGIELRSLGLPGALTHCAMSPTFQLLLILTCVLHTPDTCQAFAILTATHLGCGTCSPQAGCARAAVTWAWTRDLDWEELADGFAHSLWDLGCVLSHTGCPVRLDSGPLPRLPWPAARAATFCVVTLRKLLNLPVH